MRGTTKNVEIEKCETRRQSLIAFAGHSCASQVSTIVSCKGSRECLCLSSRRPRSLSVDSRINYDVDNSIPFRQRRPNYDRKCDCQSTRWPPCALLLIHFPFYSSHQPWPPPKWPSAPTMTIGHHHSLVSTTLKANRLHSRKKRSRRATRKTKCSSDSSAPPRPTTICSDKPPWTWRAALEGHCHSCPHHNTTRRARGPRSASSGTSLSRRTCFCTARKAQSDSSIAADRHKACPWPSAPTGTLRARRRASMTLTSARRAPRLSPP